MINTPIDLTNAKILIVDDTPENIKVLRQTLETEGYSILVATSGEACLTVANRAIPDLILLDVMMPGLNGFETCRHLKNDETTRDIPVIFITARAETEAIVEGFQTGGVDYIIKPFQDDEVLIRVKTHLQVSRLAHELQTKNGELTQANNKLRSEINRRETLTLHEAEHWGIDGFIGQSTTIRNTLTAISRLQTIEPTVLITGESGTGKELIARAIHHGSPRSSGPFVPVNCSAIPAELAESTLFGHTKGAFTGADRDRVGYFELADGGTLLLDEIGDMPLDLQTKLLRVLEDGIILSIGSTTEKKVNVRVLAATNANLETDINTGKFRQDLYFRIARFPVQLPPLRERSEDITLLAHHFLHLFAAEMGLRAPKIHSDTLHMLQTYNFPGNVRELKNIIERAVIESNGQTVHPKHLHLLQTPSATPDSSASSHSFPPSDTLPLNLKDAEELLIQRALDQTNGNIAATARLLGTNRPHIYKFLEEKNKNTKEQGSKGTEET